MLRSSLIQACICAFVALLATTTTSQAGIILTITQDAAGNVDASGSGSIDTSALVSRGSAVVSPFVQGNPAAVVIGTGQGGSPFDFYTGIAGPTAIGSGTVFHVATTGFGSILGLDTRPGTTEELLELPPGYHSGDPLVSDSTWANTTLGGLGLTPGTHTWTWGSGATADSFEVKILSVPEPSGLILVVAAVAVIAFPRRRVLAAIA